MATRRHQHHLPTAVIEPKNSGGVIQVAACNYARDASLLAATCVNLSLSPIRFTRPKINSKWRPVMWLATTAEANGPFLIVFFSYNCNILYITLVSACDCSRLLSVQAEAVDPFFFAASYCRCNVCCLECQQCVLVLCWTL